MIGGIILIAIWLNIMIMSSGSHVNTCAIPSPTWNLLKLTCSDNPVIRYGTLNYEALISVAYLTEVSIIILVFYIGIF